MKVFISWSGPISKGIAEALHNWLPRVIQSVTPWVSAEDIAKGARWSAELTRQLETTRIGILCITPGNTNSPWLLFEAGALSKTTEATFVCPYLFSVETTELTGPLAGFQASRADRDGTKRLLQTINAATGSTTSLTEKQLDETFEVWWPRLESALKKTADAHAAEPRHVRTDHDMLKEVLELLRAITRRQTSVDLLSSGQVPTGDVVRSIEEAKRLLQSGKGIEISPQAIAVELAERLPDVLKKSLSNRRTSKKGSRV
jgi:hypothetical protein